VVAENPIPRCVLLAKAERDVDEDGNWKIDWCEPFMNRAFKNPEIPKG
jgi:hypothetical protein